MDTYLDLAFGLLTAAFTDGEYLGLLFAIPAIAFPLAFTIGLLLIIRDAIRPF